MIERSEGRVQKIPLRERNGRDGQIRTADPSHPKRVLYQAEPRPDDGEAGVLL